MDKVWRLFLFLLGIFLGACSPLLHSFPEDVHKIFQSIRIETIPEKNGQYLKLRLEKILTPQGNGPCRYRLKTDITKTEQLMGMGKDATTRRLRMTVSATYTLIEMKTGQNVFSSTLKTHSSYNYIWEGFYANTVSQQAAERSCLDVLASLISLELGRFFASEAHSQKTLKVY